MSAVVELPLEIWDYIIDDLHDDIEALQACSLTCRQWLSKTRFYLFRKFRLVKGSYLELHPVLQSGSNSTIGSMVTYVRDLTIEISANLHEELKMLTYFGSTIELTLTHFVDYDLLTWNYFASTLVNVDTLHLHYWSLTDPVDFIVLLSSFPALSNLHLRQVITDTPIPAALSQPGSTLITMPLSTDKTRSLANVVLDSQPLWRRPTHLPNVFTLLGPPYFSNYPSRLELVLISRCIGRLGDEGKVNRIVEEAGTSLEHLHLTIWEPISSSPAWSSPLGSYTVTASTSFFPSNFSFSPTSEVSRLLPERCTILI